MCVQVVHYPFYVVSVPIYTSYQFPHLARYRYYYSYYYYYYYYLGGVGVWIAGFRICLWFAHFCWKRRQSLMGIIILPTTNCKLSSKSKTSFENSVCDLKDY